MLTALAAVVIGYPCIVPDTYPIAGSKPTIRRISGESIWPPARAGIVMGRTCRYGCSRGI